ncbi:metal ABC transporter permease [Phycisphaerales bacterium AB-hyl4]|uniref:Metal ABC transporter permease n=1 Tax=Natronomicrosphaera hydrolytica TaxID=3242702 RepID=A0ABV4U1Z3_9BACT
MGWTHFDTWIVIIGALAALACALPGCYLVLRRMSLMGDAISHAVLPGLAIAFLVTASRASWPMFIGAAAVGMLTALLSGWVERFGKVEAQAALGVVFTALFALGLILIRMAADHVDLDADCVLYGEIELAPLRTAAIAGANIPTAALVTGGMLLVNVLVLGLLYKEMKISAFDPQLATTLGINASAMHYLLMGLVAATVVSAFESVGSILVIAMLIVPGAIGHLLSDRLSVMIGIAAIVAVLSSVLGHVGAITLPPLIGFEDTRTAGMMVVAAGGLFVLAMLFGPRYGLLSRAITQLGLGLRIAQEDMLAMLYRLEEQGQQPAVVRADQLGATLDLGPMRRRLLRHRLHRSGRVTRTAEGYALTDAGRSFARDLVRTHRLWETYLDRYTGTPSDHLHVAAEQLEHATSATLQRALAERTGSPPTDPQGKHIPAPRDDTGPRA